MGSFAMEDRQGVIAKNWRIGHVIPSTTHIQLLIMELYVRGGGQDTHTCTGD